MDENVFLNSFPWKREIIPAELHSSFFWVASVLNFSLIIRIIEYTVYLEQFKIRSQQGDFSVLEYKILIQPDLELLEEVSGINTVRFSKHKREILPVQEKI